MSRVLVAEDDQTIRALTVEALGLMGVEAVGAENGRVAVELLHSGPFDLVLMDCQMPGVDGYEATRSIREDPLPELANIPIIALTASSATLHRVRCRAVGMDDCLLKPFSISGLAQTLNRWLPKRPALEPLRGSLPEAPSPAATAQPIDERVLESLLAVGKSGDSPQMLQKLVERFLENLPSTISSILAAPEAEQAKREAHRLKSSSLALGARRLSYLCARIENSAPNDEPSSLAAEIADEASKVEFALREFSARRLSA